MIEEQLALEGLVVALSLLACSIQRRASKSAQGCWIGFIYLVFETGESRNGRSRKCFFNSVLPRQECVSLSWLYVTLAPFISISAGLQGLGGGGQQTWSPVLLPLCGRYLDGVGGCKRCPSAFCPLPRVLQSTGAWTPDKQIFFFSGFRSVS